MRFEKLAGSDVRIVYFETHRDARGRFARVWCADRFAAEGLSFTPVQANTSVTYGVGSLRGMHYQRAPRPDPKLVRCTRGCIHDVTVDLRPESPCYGRACAVELSADRDVALFVPGGFAHGFQSLSDEVAVEYLMGERYNADLYAGFRHDDPAIGIVWPRPVATLSDRDAQWPPLGSKPGLVE